MWCPFFVRFVHTKKQKRAKKLARALARTADRNRNFLAVITPAMDEHSRQCHGVHEFEVWSKHCCSGFFGNAGTTTRQSVARINYMYMPCTLALNSFGSLQALIAGWAPVYVWHFRVTLGPRKGREQGSGR